MTNEEMQELMAKVTRASDKAREAEIPVEMLQQQEVIRQEMLKIGEQHNG